jgi:hypothetical protein|nr:MAG TPA: baseplate wedge protein [Caudoviricetes sp.]
MDELIFKTILLKGEAGNNISNIQKTATSGNVDTYTITLTDGSTTTFDVTNGNGIVGIEKTGASGNVDTYTITLTDGSTTTFDVTNGNGIENIEKTATSGLVDTYTITFTDGSTTTFDVTNGNSVDTDALKEEIYKEMYPVGHVVISFNNTNPAKYGTVWERTGAGRMLLGVSDDYEVGDTGGEETHTLTINEIPSHSHDTLFQAKTYNEGYGSYEDKPIVLGNTLVSDTVLWDTTSTGGGQPHNNMPPYIAVYMWRRVS